MTSIQSFNVSAAGPAGGTVLASLTNLAAGHEYAVSVYAYYSGTGVATADNNNMALFVDGASVTPLLIAGVGAGSSLALAPQRFNVITQQGSIQLKVIGAGTGAQIFNTLLVVEDTGASAEDII